MTILEHGFRDATRHLDSLNPAQETPAVFLYEDAPKKSDLTLCVVLEVVLSLSEEELRRPLSKSRRATLAKAVHLR